jgi:multidrug transporter EmrE-like cation transporter
MVEIYGYSIATIPVVCGVVYAVIELIKYFLGTKVDKFKKYIPVVSCFIGAMISLIVFFIAPELVPVATWYSALLMGGASGLSAVGVNQIKKQIQKQGGETSDS